VFTRNLITRSVSVAVAAAVIGALTPANSAAQTPVGFSVVGGLSLPVGDLARSSDLGLNIGFRGEGRTMPSGWAFRGDMNFDRYAGNGTIENFTYVSFAGNLVHRTQSGRAWQYGGLGVYNSKVARTNAVDLSDTDLGVQMGVGFDMTTDRTVFAELGLTSAFTSGRSSVWFPIRVGLRF
jgi:hypothetical protein